MRILIILLIAVFLISCKKNGCTDPSATNYDPNAENNDGSCQYSAPNPQSVNCLDGVFNTNITYGNVTDIDGNNYKTVQIGTQNWMAENLKVTHYQNGDPIANVTDTNQWTNLNTGAWIHYSNNSANDCSEGKLYNFFAVTDLRKICPQGWHIPTDTEWFELIQFIDPNAEISAPLTWGGFLADYYPLLSKGTTQNPTWETSFFINGLGPYYQVFTGMTNATGFSLVSSGSYERGPFDNIHSLKDNRVFSDLWSSTGIYLDWAGLRGIEFSFTVEYSSPTYLYSHARRSDGNACRCVQD
jgi:uncharacterized protein (TIGR02145 family)